MSGLRRLPDTKQELLSSAEGSVGLKFYNEYTDEAIWVFVKRDLPLDTNPYSQEVGFEVWHQDRGTVYSGSDLDKLWDVLSKFLLTP
jgi:hypothetical protein